MTKYKSWTIERHIKLLGTMSDARLADRLSTTRPDVTRERKERGIEPYIGKYTRHDWKPSHVGLLRVRSDRDVAEMLGLSVSTVNEERRRRGFSAPTDRRNIYWTPAMIMALGLRPDRDLARAWGISCTTVFRKRKSLDIGMTKNPKKYVA